MFNMKIDGTPVGLVASDSTLMKRGLRSYCDQAKKDRVVGLRSAKMVGRIRPGSAYTLSGAHHRQSLSVLVCHCKHSTRPPMVEQTSREDHCHTFTLLYLVVMPLALH